MDNQLDGYRALSERMPANGGRIEGTSPLAGHFSLPSLLVREAVQNSWDARDDERGARPVRFSIHGHDLVGGELDHLRTLLPVQDLEGFERRSETDDSKGTLHPAAVLERPVVRVLVISDRGTVGLCGPTLSGVAWNPVRHGKPLPRGVQRFANFVRNVGRAASDTGGGDGGSYGIGKSVLWMASECGTVLIHTRTTDEHGEPVERFIGSVYGDHFYSNDREFTGRHFLGVDGPEGSTEPLIGSAAAAAARGLPTPAYNIEGEEVGGTTIVIVAPQMHLDWETEMHRIGDAVRWHVWPKRVAGLRSEQSPPDMEIDLAFNGNAVYLPLPHEDPEIAPYAGALVDAALGRVSPEPNRDFEARCGSPAKSLGWTKFRRAGTADQNAFHLTLTSEALAARVEQVREAPEGAERAFDEEPVVPFPQPWGHVALVRREPLLLVRYEPISRSSDAASEEVGAFLSARDPDVEEALTKAEPPAHDEWLYRNVPKDSRSDHRRTYAKRAVEEINRAKRDFLASQRPTVSGRAGSSEQLVSKGLSEGLLGGTAGRPKPKPTSDTTSPPPSRKPRLDLREHRSYQRDHQLVHELVGTIANVGSERLSLILTADGSAYDNVGRIADSNPAQFEWLVGSDCFAGSVLPAQAKDGDEVILVVRLDSDVRYRPKVGVALGPPVTTVREPGGSSA